jgi:RNA polymerase sigma-70 factor (ECF subfamily)
MDAARKKRPVGKENIEDSACPAPDAAQGLEDRRRDEAVRAAIRRLPRRQRSAIILKEYCELSYAQIGEVLSTSTKSVERLLARAREALQKDLKRFCK